MASTVHTDLCVCVCDGVCVCVCVCLLYMYFYAELQSRILIVYYGHMS